MSHLLTIVIVLLGTSFICSLLEAILLSVSTPYIHTLIEKKKKSGHLWKKYKAQINESIASILTLNTIANTAGAAVAGSVALQLWGSEWIALFSGVLTLLILFFSEIIPKTIGASYWKELASPAVYILRVLIIISKPIVIPINAISSLISVKKNKQSITREDVMSSIRLGHLEGLIESSEFDFVCNIFKLKHLTVRDIMTSRTVVFSLSPDQTVEEAMEYSGILHHSRIPIYDKSKNQISGVVLRRDIILNAASGKKDIQVKDLLREPLFIPGTVSCFILLDRLISRKTHISFVINEYGDYMGIVTLEDLVEALLGREIVDESDNVINMQEFAKNRLKEQLLKQKGGISEQNS